MVMASNAKTRLTPAQKRALRWLANATGDMQKANHWMIGANVQAQTAHNLHRAGLIRVVDRSWDGSMNIVAITATGRAAVSGESSPVKTCQHDWRQVELDAQECHHCGATCSAFSSGYESYLL